MQTMIVADGLPNRSSAIGIFHFNLQYIAGDVSAYHQYVLRTIVPFIEFARKQIGRVFTIEISGSALLFLDKHYPSILIALRNLLRSGALELITTTFFPTIWPAFPGRDLRKSVEINNQVLLDLGLPYSPIFLAQECFFGYGLTNLVGLVDYVVCKNEQISFYGCPVPAATLYRMGPLKVLAGAGHLFNELATFVDGDFINKPVPVSNMALKALSQGRSALDRSNGLFRKNNMGGHDYWWFHLGSGHCVVSPEKPSGLMGNNEDGSWASLVEAWMRRVEDEGFAFTSLKGALSKLPESAAVELDSPLETSWNPAASRGLFQWMGANANPWQDNSALLGSIWRARREVLRCEKFISAAGEAVAEEYSARLQKAWEYLIKAQSSDPLGWFPTRSEASSGFSAALICFQYAAGLSFEISERLGVKIEDPRQLDYEAIDPPFSKFSVIGTGKVTWRRRADGLYVFEVEIQSAEAGECGIVFETELKIGYSPSGREDILREIDLMDLPAGKECHIPLANGIVRLREKQYLIRLNEFGQPPLRLKSGSPSIAFLVNRTGVTQCTWRFAYFEGDEREALRYALELNLI